MCHQALPVSRVQMPPPSPPSSATFTATNILTNDQMEFRPYVLHGSYYESLHEFAYPMTTIGARLILGFVAKLLPIRPRRGPAALCWEGDEVEPAFADTLAQYLAVLELMMKSECHFDGWVGCYLLALPQDRTSDDYSKFIYQLNVHLRYARM